MSFLPSDSPTLCSVVVVLLVFSIFLCSKSCFSVPKILTVQLCMLLFPCCNSRQIFWCGKTLDWKISKEREKEKKYSLLNLSVISNSNLISFNLGSLGANCRNLNTGLLTLQHVLCNKTAYSDFCLFRWSVQFHCILQHSKGNTSIDKYKAAKRS